MSRAVKPRHFVLALALVAAVLPGGGRGWFGIESSSASSSTLAWGSLGRAPLGSERALEIPLLPTAVTPNSAPAPVVTPSTLAPAAPTPEPEPVVIADDPVLPEPVAVPPPDPAPAPPKPAPPPAVVAHARETGIVVYEKPEDTASALRYRGTTEFGTPRVLLTTLASPIVSEPWVEVYLPTRPNGATGWIRAESVELAMVSDRITVDLTARTVTWERGADVVGVVSAAVGTARTPTPTGTYFVTDVLPYHEVGAASPNGEYGAWVVALNGHSDAFTTFDGGDARIAIHGTNQPASIGAAASSGCVRIAAEPLENLARSVPLGTPVVIR